MPAEAEATYSLDDIVMREHVDDDRVVAAVTNFQYAASAYQEVRETIEAKAESNEFGTRDEIMSAHETLRRSFYHSLEELSEQDITWALEQGHMTEVDAKLARKEKRLMELEQLRERQVREAERGREGPER